MKIACIADTHGLPFERPECDLLLHAGDAFSSWSTLADVDALFAQLGNRSVYVPGNHDRIVANNLFDAKAIAMKHSVLLLVHESTVVDGVRIFGSPWAPMFGRGSTFMKPYDDLQQLWESTNARPDILVTHGPPLGVLDLTSKGVYAGCNNLEQYVYHAKPRLHVFGHIHESRGIFERRRRISVNASMHDFYTDTHFEPIVLEF